MTASAAEPKPTPIPGLESIPDMDAPIDGLWYPQVATDLTPIQPLNPTAEWDAPLATGRIENPFVPPTPGEINIDLETVRPGSLAVLSMRRWLAERSEARAADRLRQTHGEDQMKPMVAAVKLGIPINERELPRDFSRREEREIVKHRASTKGSKAIGMQAWGMQKSARDLHHATPEQLLAGRAKPIKRWHNQRIWSSKYSRDFHTLRNEAISTLVTAIDNNNTNEEQLAPHREALAAATARVNSLRDRELRVRQARNEQWRRSLQNKAQSLRDRAARLADTAEQQALGYNPDGADTEQFLGARAAWNEYQSGVVLSRAERLEQRAENPTAQSRTGRAVRSLGRGVAHGARTARHKSNIVRERIVDSRVARLESSGHDLINRSSSRLRGISIPFYTQYVSPTTANRYLERGQRKIERAARISEDARDRRVKKYGSAGPETTPDLDDNDPVVQNELAAVISDMIRPGSPEQTEWEAHKAQFEAEDHSADGRTLEDLRDEWAAEIEQRARRAVAARRRP